MLDRYNKEMRIGAIKLHSVKTPFYKQDWFKHHAIACLVTASFVGAMILAMIVGVK